MHTGVGQGIQRSLISIAAILGPLWAGGAVALDTYYALLGVPLGLLLLVTVWVHVHCSCGMVQSLCFYFLYRSYLLYPFQD